MKVRQRAHRKSEETKNGKRRNENELNERKTRGEIGKIAVMEEEREREKRCDHEYGQYERLI